jgi:hypothetical protein
MKPGRSGAATGTLPMRSTNAVSERTVGSLVVSARTTSTSFINGTGLKKCRPPKRSGLRVAAASSTIASDDVLLAMRASSRRTGSTAA